MHRPGNIAVFLPNPLGDVVMSTPALRAIRQAYADARIVHVARGPAVETLEGEGLSDAIIIDRSRGSLAGKVDLVRRLRGGRFDLGVLMPNSLRCAALARLGGVGMLTGYARDARGWLLARRLAPARDSDGRYVPVPMIDYYLALAQAVGAPPVGRTMELAVTEAGEAQARQLLDQAGWDPLRATVMLNPGAAFGPSKLWLPHRWGQLAEALEGLGAQIVLNAAPGERAIAALVENQMARPPMLSFASRDNTITLVKSLIARCSVVITPDTGARHLAAALGVGVVTLFGSTDPVWAETDYPLERKVRAEGICTPCQQKVCPLPEGPEHHRCMHAIEVGDVLASARELLAAVPPAGAAARR